MKNRKFEIHRKEFDAFCQLPSESIDDMFARFQVIVNKMKAMNSDMPYDDHARALRLLHSLNDEWDMKVEAIVESAGYETLTTDELYSKLKSKEIKIVSKRKLKNPIASSSSDVPMALISGNKTNSNAIPNVSSFALSSLCHVADEELEVLDDGQLVLLSNKFKRVYDNRRNRRRSDACYNCGERGHFAADCPNKMKSSEQGNSSFRRQEQFREKKKKKEKRWKKGGQNTLISKSPRLHMFCYPLLKIMFQMARQTPVIQTLRMRHPRRRPMDFASSLTPTTMVGYVLWPWRTM